MRTIMLFCSAVVLAGAAPLPADSVFTGTWKGDVAAAQPSKKPNVYLLNAGTYTCSTCVPKVMVPADGAFHKVAGNPYWDEIAVTVVDASTVRRVTRKAGKTMGEGTTIVSADGKTARYTFNDMTAPNGEVVTGDGVDQRVAMGPKGAHALSGSWQPTNQGTVSDSGLTYMVALDGDTFSYKTPIGTSFVAKIGGPEAPVTGDPGWTSVQLRRTGANTLVETDLRDGKPISRLTMTVSPDGRKMTVGVNDLLRGRTGTYIARKQ